MIFHSNLCVIDVMIQKFFLVFFLLISNLVFSQTRKYTIKVVGIKVGTLTASKLAKDDTVSYSLSSKVDVNFLIYRLKVDYLVKSILSQGQLLKSSVHVDSNRGKFITETKATEKGYSIESIQHDKEIDTNIKVRINKTFASMFFNEPKIGDKIYAEYYGDFIQISKPSKGFYTGVLKDTEDEFYYENGMVLKIVKKNKITDMVIEYLPPSNKITR